MSLFVKDKNFYKSLFSIALPIASQNLITFTVGMVDTVMLGMLGEVTLSAASLAGQFFFILMITGFGVGSAATVFASQYWGKGDTASIKKVLTIMLRIMLLCCHCPRCSLLLLFSFPAASCGCLPPTRML